MARLAELKREKPAGSKVGTDIPAEIAVPDKMHTRIGMLTFADGAPSDDTVEKVYDNLDFIHAVDAYMNAYQGASTYAMYRGLRDIGVEDNSFVIFSELMDSQTLFLTANADTVYYVGFISLKDGPMVFETPPDALGVIDDMWFHHVIDFGRSGPDRGQGGKFLLLPPGYDGPLPDSGFHSAEVRTTRALVLGRSFLADNDPGPVVETIKETLRVYPYTPGGYGTSVATLLEGTIRPGKAAPVTPVRYVEGSGLAFTTIPPSDASYYEMVNALVQEEPAGALDAEIMGSLAAIGIMKGTPFRPDGRMRTILADAAAVASATGRTLDFRPRGKGEEDWAFYPGSAWYNWLFQGGYTFETPPPAVTPEGITPYPPTGYRHLNARFGFFYFATGITPAMCMLLTDIGSQYLLCALDAEKNYLDGGKTYRCTLPPDIPQNNFWSLTVYDNQTRSMLRTPQRFPRAGSQSYPTPAAVPNADGSVDIFFGPKAPEGRESNWIQTVPDRGWFTILRLYSPLHAFFDRSWKIGEIEPVD
jgi:hypothetical protein